MKAQQQWKIRLRDNWLTDSGKNFYDYKTDWVTSLTVQWLRLDALKAGGLGSIPGWGTKSCKRHSQTNKQTKKDWLSSEKKDHFPISAHFSLSPHVAEQPGLSFTTWLSAQKFQVCTDLKIGTSKCLSIVRPLCFEVTNKLFHNTRPLYLINKIIFTWIYIYKRDMCSQWNFLKKE